jgi:hypothetical protein
MEDESSSPTSGAPNNVSAPVGVHPSQSSEEPKSSPVPSMSGALQGGDVDDDPKTADEDEGMRLAGY